MENIYTHITLFFIGYLCILDNFETMRLKWLLYTLMLNSSASFAGDHNAIASTKYPIILIDNSYNDNDTIVIPFGYKQSALYHANTFEVIDSVVNILMRDTATKLTIDGYAFIDEGNDTIIKYLSLNRALFVKEYILGRGIDLSRIISVNGLGTSRSLYKSTDAEGKNVYCRAELLLIYPPPQIKLIPPDRDADGIADTEDSCPDEYGYADTKGCPNKDVVIVPFEARQTYLFATAYKILDSLIGILKENPSYTIILNGHAYKEEGTRSVCNGLAQERVNITKAYLVSRYIDAARIIGMKNWGDTRPLNAGRDPQEKDQNACVEIILNRNL